MHNQIIVLSLKCGRATTLLFRPEAMNIEDQLLRFENEMHQIVLFAKRINFDVETGDVTELIRLWLNDSKAFYDADNQEFILSVMKSMLK